MKWDLPPVLSKRLLSFDGIAASSHSLSNVCEVLRTWERPSGVHLSCDKFLQVSLYGKQSILHQYCRDKVPSYENRSQSIHELKPIWVETVRTNNDFWEGHFARIWRIILKMHHFLFEVYVFNACPYFRKNELFLKIPQEKKTSRSYAAFAFWNLL